MEYDFEDFDGNKNIIKKKTNEKIEHDIALARTAILEDQGICKGFQPVGRKKFSKSFWSQKWLLHLTNFEQVDHRLKQGRSVFRKFGVLDWHIKDQSIRSYVWEQETYKAEIYFDKVSAEELKNLSLEITGEITSVLELLNGKISDSLAHKITKIFPSLNEINFCCNCLDFADFCSHTAVSLYALAMHLDSKPEAFFELRGIDLNLLWKENQENFAETISIDSHLNLSSTFGIDME